jgi:hypothetical protein
MDALEEEALARDKRSKALALHERVKRSLQQFDYDLYTHKYSDHDSLVNSCMIRVREDEDRREKIKDTPSAIRERFTSRYWQRWDKDLKILQHASLQSSSSAASKQPPAYRDDSQMTWKQKKRAKGLSFGKPYSSPPSVYDRPVKITPQAAVHAYMKVSKLPIPSISSESCQGGDPHRAIDKNIKGIRFV